MANLNRTVVSQYENLKGVDLSSPPSLVDKNRSPYCLNLMPDESLNPVKRPGWETVYSFDSEVYNIWFCTVKGKKYCLCHVADGIYSLEDGNAVLLKSGVNQGKGCGFYALKGEEGGFYMLTGGDYLCFDGNSVTDVTQNAYAPLVAIAKTPSGGGESYEDINLLTSKRRENFIGTESDLIYQLGTDGIDGVISVEVLQADGTRHSLAAQTDYTVDKDLGKITFVKAQPTPLAGHDNIYVTYSKTVEGYKEKITNCTIATLFGLGGENRVFLSGNAGCPHKDFWSGVFDPTYFSDLCYAVIGSGQTAVMGYLKMGERLGIVKSGNGQDTSLFLREAQADSDGRAVFTVQSGISSFGAVSKHCFALLNDEPLFLSSQGILAVTNSLVTSEKIIVHRSHRIDAKLTKEQKLENAVACVWKNFYMLSANGSCYLLDSRQISAAKSGEKNSGYEAYLWDNVFANCFATDGDVLWFGTADGRVRRFKTNVDENNCYSDDGRAIYAVWQTPMEDEGHIERYKTLSRKGCLVSLKPYNASGCSIYYSVEGGVKRLVRMGYVDITQAFAVVDFARMTFNTSGTPQDIYFYCRHRRYKRIQLIFENNQPNEGFGIQKIVKTYKINTHSENRR